jgi:hypothetical protein
MPIPVPVAPTDNLYKFMAIFGLAVVVASAILIGMKAHEFNDHISGSVVPQIELSILESRRKELLAAESEALHNRMQELPHSQPATAPIAKALSEVMTQLNDQIAAKKAEVDMESAKTSVGKKILDSAIFDYSIGAGVGICFAGLGFYYWYHRLQKPQDELLKAQVAKILRDLTTSNPFPTKDENDWERNPTMTTYTQ